MQESILILDFGSQYTQLIARRVRELNVYSEIIPWNAFKSLPEDVSGWSFPEAPTAFGMTDAPKPDLSAIVGKVPLLGVCYGAQYLGHPQRRQGGGERLSGVRPCEPRVVE